MGKNFEGHVKASRLTIRDSAGTEVTIRAEWGGGAYVDLYARNMKYPGEVINVWDYETDEPAIPFTQSSLRMALKRWVADYAEHDSNIMHEILNSSDELVHDIMHNWYPELNRNH